jgi:hypothetical protein
MKKSYILRIDNFGEKLYPPDEITLKRIFYLISTQGRFFLEFSLRDVGRPNEPALYILDGAREDVLLRAANE